MSATTAVTVWCDVSTCSRSITDNGDAEEVRAEAERAGWRTEITDSDERPKFYSRPYGGYVDLCPKHRDGDPDAGWGV